MITLNQAKQLRVGETIHHISNRNADSTPQRWSINGEVKTWKRSPDRVKVPLKHGLYVFDYLTEANLQEFTLCPF